MGFMKVGVSVDNEALNQKPAGKEITAAKKRTAESWREVELEELADLNGNKGHTIIPAHLAGGI